ncbi:hypothetical protein CANINC_001100 [Pichia inconspicua]|uniref:Uncharacterized protein n=1 Tax=Pichia inconspicua TaxID=52247 RepID=A0A4T0X4X8_9ASCO|nr:hypothetical protein CANINC_001100 [[Candida] inconspicua]
MHPTPPASPAPVAEPDGTPLSYIVVIDAGSKGTRAYLYAYSPNDRTKLINLPDWHKRIRPSIESFVLSAGLNYNNVSLYLTHLLFKINTILPIEQHYRTPIFFHSTAGFRLLEPDTQSTLLSHICTYLQTNTNYYIPHCDSHVSVITGEVEGLYSWITLNYLLSSTTTSSSPLLLQLGGGSAQIVYQTSTPIHSINGLTLHLPQGSINIFSNSYLGFGINQIRQDYQQSLTSSDTSTLIDPCLPLNYISTVTIDDKLYTLTGSADYSSCTNLIYDQISANFDSCASLTPFQLSQCMIPSYVDYNISQNTTFYAISGYAHIIKDIANLFNKDLSNPQERSSLPELTQKLCSSSIEQLQEFPNTNNLNNDKIASLCFNSIYVQALLQTGFNIPIDSPNLHFNKTFNNKKFTWILGRALLYALDDNTFNKTNSHYGFTYNLTPHAFINGAEQNNVPSRPQFNPDHKYDSNPFLKSPDFNPDETELIIQTSYPWLSISTIIIIIISSLIAIIIAFSKWTYIRRRIYSIFTKTRPLRSYSTKYNDSNLELAILPPNPNTIDSENSDWDIDYENDSDGIERAL